MSRFRLPGMLLALLIMGLMNAGYALPQPPAQMPNPGRTAPSASSSLKIGVGSQKVPQGTMLTIAFNTALDSRTAQIGDVFTGQLTQDFATRDSVGYRKIILPEGSIIRGRVQNVKRPGLFSHGGALYLNFDHVMLPSGELMPLTLNLSTENSLVNAKGAIYMDPGIGKKVEEGAHTGKEKFNEITESGWKAGQQIAGGLGSIVTVPAAVLGGAVAGAGITTGKAAVAVVGRGESAVIQPGDTVTIDFGGSFTLPSE